MTDPTQKMLHAGWRAVAQACRVTRHVQAELQNVRELTKDDRSPVTVADFAAQATVAHYLAMGLGVSRNVLRIVGEENAGVLRQDDHAALRQAVVDAVRHVWPGAGEDDVLEAIDACDHDASARSYWTLDPVDGTKGFLRGEQYAISLAWIENGRVDLGIMGCPNLSPDLDRPFSDPDPDGLIFYAHRDSGAFCVPAELLDVPDDAARPVHLHGEGGDEHGRIRVCESVESGHTKHDDTARIVEHLGGAGAPARLDSQCKYAVVARGQADAYLRLPTKPGYVEKIWDHAAGMLVAQEAGAIVTDIEGAPLDFSHGALLERNRGVICAAPAFHRRIIDAIDALNIAPAVG